LAKSGPVWVSSKEISFFLEKSKRLLYSGHPGGGELRQFVANSQKSFASFLQKRRPLYPFRLVETVYKQPI
jgi:hypothetical protein